MRSKLFVAILTVVMLSTASGWADAGGKSFSNKDLKGTYAVKFSGFAAGAANPFPAGTSQPQSGTGLEVADGNGNFTATLVFSIGGSTCSGTVAGTYHINSDGTGTSTGTFTPKATAPTGVPSSNYACPTQMTGIQDEAFTIVTLGRVDFISTDADSVVSGTAVRQGHNNGDD
jgi:hypothetical protein